MNVKRHRIRRTGSTPISRVRIRESHMKYISAHRHNRKWYPLFETWSTIYNYQNIMESLLNWREASEGEQTCLNRVASLLKEVKDHGTEMEFNEALEYVTEVVLLNTNDPRRAVKKFEALDEVSQEKIAQSADFFAECDRVANNFHLLDKKYNMNKMLIETCKYWPISEAVNRICEFSETFLHLPVRDRFSIFVENAMYSFNNVALDYEIPTVSITNSVIDFLLQEETKEGFDLDAFCEDVMAGAENSYFIDEGIVGKYLNYLKSINEEKELPEVMYKTSQQYIRECLDEYQYVGQSKQILQETMLDSAKEMMAKLKIAPVKSLFMVKEAIRAAMVTRRLSDIKECTHNALSIAFYALVGLGAVFSLGVIPGILAYIALCIIRTNSDKEYLKEAIQEWRDHKYAVARRLKSTTSAEQKQRLSAYLEEVDKNIDLLEEEYEKTRDKTTDELAHSNDEKHTKDGANEWATHVAPDASYSPSAFM